MQKNRMPQVNSLIHEEISMILLTELQDPRFKRVAVTGVDTSPDLAQAKVYVTFITGKEEPTEEEQKAGVEILQHAAGMIRRLLAHRIKLRRVPEIHFRYDKSSIEGARIDKELKNLGF